MAVKLVSFIELHCEEGGRRERTLENSVCKTKSCTREAAVNKRLVMRLLKDEYRSPCEGFPSITTKGALSFFLDLQ